MIPPAVCDAIDTLYVVFARYLRPAASSYSPCAGISTDDVARLRAAPMRELAPENLREFSLRALNTWGDEDEFRHYLPRMLELAVEVPNWTPLDSLLGKLDTGMWKEWPVVEQRALHEFVDELWGWLIVDEQARLSAVDLLRGASNAGMPLRPMVTCWERATGAAAVRHLASLIIREGASLSRWSAEARLVLDRFLTSDAPRRLLEAGLLEPEDRVLASDIRLALTILDGMPA